MYDGARQGQQVDDLGQIRQAVDVDGLVVDTCRSQLWQQCGKLGSAPYEYGHVFIRVPCKSLLNKPAAFIGLAFGVGAEYGVDLALTFRGQRRYRFRVGHGTPNRIVRLR